VQDAIGEQKPPFLERPDGNIRPIVTPGFGFGSRKSSSEQGQVVESMAGQGVTPPPCASLDVVRRIVENHHIEFASGAIRPLLGAGCR
jgi:hypothetical protein